MDRRIELLDTELRDLDFLARYNLYMLKHATVMLNLPFTDRQKAKRR